MTQSKPRFTMQQARLLQQVTEFRSPPVETPHCLLGSYSAQYTHPSFLILSGTSLFQARPQKSGLSKQAPKTSI